MKTIFKTLGYEFSEIPITEFQELKIMFFKSNVSQTQFAWNSSNPNPDFLNFFKASNLETVFYFVLIKLVFYVRIQDIIFKTKKVFVKKYTESGFDFDPRKNWALCTQGFHSEKAITLFFEGHYYKIVDEASSTEKLQHEHKTLLALSKERKYYIKTPSSRTVSDKVIEVSNINKIGMRWRKISYLHSWSLIEMSRYHSGNISIKEWEKFQNLRGVFQTKGKELLPSGLFQKFSLLMDKVETDEDVKLTFSHGGFAPNNIQIDSKYELSVYDWSNADSQRTYGYDFFHFIIQNELQTEKKSWKHIYEEIAEKNKIVFNMNRLDLNKYLKLYLITTFLENLQRATIVDAQKATISKTISFWNQACNAFLTREFSDRQLILMELQDFLHSRKYATLNVLDADDLHEHSNLDVLMETKDMAKTRQFLTKNERIHKIVVHKKANALELKIITKDFDVFSLSLFSKLTYKNLQILDTASLLANRVLHQMGFYQLSPADNTNYRKQHKILKNHSFLYLINPICEKYQSARSSIDDSKIYDEKNAKNALIKALKKESYNSGFSFVKNTFNYLKDSFSQKGFMISLSGVDTAEKATIISEISQMMSKNFRKKVIVLHDRPSVLPGIKKMEDQGKAKLKSAYARPSRKKSRFSTSLFLFSYYFIDYLLGQFVIYFKYVLRGYIVIYDQYYFELIVDGKKRDVQLPKKLVQFCYRFLMKPNFNFFLYDSPMSEKSKKLGYSARAMEAMTYRYQKLFYRLKKQSHSTVYQTIKNENINATLEQIKLTVFSQRSF